VVTGISAGDPLSVRAARMKIYARFTSELDGSGEKISQELSEVDLSNPEDVKALIPDHSSEVLVHFGEENFLDRYRKYQAHLAEWRTQYPRLSSVDMRYERQAVLEMQPGSAAPVTSQGAGAAPADASAGEAAAPVAKAPVAKAAAKPWKPKAVAHVAAPKAKAKTAVPGAAKQRHAAVWVHPKSGTKRAVKPNVVAHPQYHPPQVVHP
jgi:cell division protein FtsQ